MRMDILNLLWRSFGSRWLTLLLLLLVVLIVALGAVLPQRLDDLAMGSPEYTAWYAHVQARYLQWAGPLSSLGLLSARDSLWLRIPLTLLAVNLLVCAVDRFETAPWRRHPDAQDFARQFGLGSQNRSLLFVGDRESALASLRELIERFGYTVEARESDGDYYLTARRLTSGAWGALLGHVGLVLLVASVLVGSRVAWWERDVVLGPGQEYQGQHDMSLTVRLDDFHEYSSASGGAASYRASVTILENGIEVAEGAVSPGQPMRHRGVFLYQLSHGPLIKVRGVAAEGSAISLQTLGPAGELLKEASLQLSEGDNEGYVAVPDRNLVLRVVFQPGSASDAQGSPSLLLQAYRGGTTDLVFTDSFAQSASVQIEDDSYAVEWGEYAVLGLAHDPSIAPMMLGAIMLLTGTTVAMLVRPRCFWAAVKGKEGVVQASLLNAAEDTKGSGAREFERLMAELEEACRGS